MIGQPPLPGSRHLAVVMMILILDYHQSCTIRVIVILHVHRLNAPSVLTGGTTEAAVSRLNFSVCIWHNFFGLWVVFNVVKYSST